MNHRSNRQPRGAGAGLLPFALVLPLLALPAYALSRYGTGILAISIAVAVSLIAYLAHRTDKQRAESGGWRIPELTLHLVELLGGWPGAFLAMRIYRHKTAKLGYQAMFWFIVVIYQWAAFDSLAGFRYTKALLPFIR